jgi:hypothetical protein
MQSLRSTLDLLLLLSALGTAALAWIKLVRPRVQARAAERAAVNEVLLGAPAVPANPITGAPARPKVPAIGQQVADLRDVVDALAEVLEQVRHEVHPNDGSSMKDAVGRTERLLGEVSARLSDGDRRFDEQGERLVRIEGVLADELRVATDAVANAAEASKTVLSVIDAAIAASPPPDL